MSGLLLGCSEARNDFLVSGHWSAHLYSCLHIVPKLKRQLHEASRSITKCCAPSMQSLYAGLHSRNTLTRNDFPGFIRISLELSLVHSSSRSPLIHRSSIETNQILDCDFNSAKSARGLDYKLPNPTPAKQLRGMWGAAHKPINDYGFPYYIYTALTHILQHILCMMPLSYTFQTTQNWHDALHIRCNMEPTSNKTTHVLHERQM